jgi:hypothetical protein
MFFWIPTAVALITRAFWPKKGETAGRQPTVYVYGYRVQPVVLPRDPIKIVTSDKYDKYRYSYVDSNTQFIQVFGPTIRDVERIYGFSKGIIMGHAANESSWGQYVVANNLFNIKKGDDWKGKTVKKEHGTYRVYNSFTDSALDYVRLVGAAGRYKDAWNNRANASAFFKALYKGGYFEDEAAVTAFIGAAKDTAGMIA